MHLSLRAKIGAGVAAVALVGTGAGVAAAVSSSRSPTVAQVIAPSGAVDSTTTSTLPPDMTVAPPLTVVVAPATTTTLAPAPTTTLAPVTTTTLDPNVTVPNIVGMTYSAAQSTLTSAGLKINPGSACGNSGDPNPDAVVTAQGPSPGYTLQRGDLVVADC